MKVDKTLSRLEIEFLQESNYIEGERSIEALQDAIKAWLYIRDKKRLTVKNILQTHKILMRTRDIEDKYKGAFRDVEVTIAGRLGAASSLISVFMMDWIQHANSYYEFWQRHHVRYENIHPFIDGNGRTGRIFMNWMRIRTGLVVLVIDSSEREKYYKWFRQGGDVTI